MPQLSPMITFAMSDFRTYGNHVVNPLVIDENVTRWNTDNECVGKSESGKASLFYTTSAPFISEFKNRATVSVFEEQDISFIFNEYALCERAPQGT